MFICSSNDKRMIGFLAELCGYRARSGSFLQKTAALALCCTVLSCATQPLLLAQDATAVTSTPTQTTQPTSQQIPQVSPKQIEKARSLFTKGTEALRKEQSERAILLLSRAHQLDPSNAEYLAGYEIAKQQQVTHLLRTAEKQQNGGKPDAAIVALQQAQSLDPDNPFVREHIQAMNAQPPAIVQTNPLPELDSGQVTLAAQTSPETFHLHASAQDLIHQVFTAYGITALVDDSVPTTRVRLDMDGASFAAASAAVQLVTSTFIVPLDPHRVLVAKDTPQNREKFERLLVETIYLPGLGGRQMTDATNLIKNVFGVKQVGVQQDNGTMSIRAPESTMRAINLTIANLYQGQPEVILDVRVYQVNYTSARVLGPQLPQQFTAFNVTTAIQGLINSNQSLINQLIAAGLVSPGDYAAIAALLVYYGLASGSILGQPFALFGNGLSLTGLSFGTTSFNASLNTSDARELDHVQLRAENEQTSRFLFGSRYPITTQSYSGSPAPPNIPGLAGALGLGGFAGLGANSSTSGINALTTTPQVQFEDLGLTLKVTPKIQRDQQVHMQLDLKLESLAGSSLNGIPVLVSRAFVSSIEVHNGDSALVVSNMTRQEANVLSGIPGVSELPGLAYTGTINKQVTVGDLVLVVTPHIVNFSRSSVASTMIPMPSVKK